MVRFVIRFLEDSRQHFLEVRSMPYRHRVGTHKVRTDQLPRYASSSSSVAIWVWSSFANLSISRITSSVRPNSCIVFLNHACVTVVFFTTFLLPAPVTVWPARSARTCSGRCQRPNTSDMLCIVLLAPHTISHSSVFPAALIASCDSLKCLSLRVVLDLLNVDAM